MQVPRAPARNLLGLGAEQPRELPLEAQPRVLRDHALADGVRDLIAAQPEHVDRCPGRQQIGLSTRVEVDPGGVGPGGGGGGGGGRPAGGGGGGGGGGGRGGGGVGCGAGGTAKERKSRKT